jgi:hypothetical protein
MNRLFLKNFICMRVAFPFNWATPTPIHLHSSSGPFERGLTMVAVVGKRASFLSFVFLHWKLIFSKTLVCILDGMDV